MQKFANRINIFSSRKNRFSETGPTFRFNNINKIRLSVGFESKNDKEDYFINYLNSDKQENYDRLLKLYNQIKNNDFSFINKEYECDELFDNGKVVDRLINVLNYDTNLNLSKSDIYHIFKLKSKDNKKLHLYIDVNNEIGDLILIDLYHLSMPSDVIRNKIVVRRGSLEETRKDYLKHELCRYNINNIIKDESID